MFIIAGISPRTIALDQNPRRCPSCGLYQATLRRTDSYLSLFFIPLLRVKKGEPYLFCERCGHAARPDAAPFQPRQEQSPNPLCKTCGRTLKGEFKYCPYCGRKV